MFWVNYLLLDSPIIAYITDATADTAVGCSVGQLGIYLKSRIVFAPCGQAVDLAEWASR